MSNVPPSLSNIMSVLPVEQNARSTIKLTASDLPTSFDWRDSGFQGYDDILNQKCCGNCWSIGTTNSLSLRYAIQQNSVCPKLSILHLAACDQSDSGCNGGMPTSAFEFIKNYGIPEATSDDLLFDNWCASSECSSTSACASGPQLNISLRQQCANSASYNLFFISKYYYNVTLNNDGTINRQQTIHQIKDDIYRNGPVVVGYQVFADFESGPAWPESNGIYVHDPSSPLVGGHAVVLVGWGRGNAGKYGTLDYWIMKNSWGKDWGNDGGYCKIAISTDDGLNKDLYMDVPTIVGGNYWGGAVGILTIENTSPKYKKNNYSGGTRNPGSDVDPTGITPSSKSSHKYIVIGSVAAAAIVIAIILFFLLKK